MVVLVGSLICRLIVGGGDIVLDRILCSELSELFIWLVEYRSE